MVTFLFVLGILVLLFCIIGIFFLTKNENVLSIAYKIAMCENEIDDRLKNKEDLVLRCINIINRQLKLDIKVFEEVKNLKVSKLANYDKDKLLTSAFSEITKIYFDNSDLKNVKSFDGIIRDIENLEIDLISLRTLYNKCSCEFNSMYHKFPYKIICKMKKLSIKNLYEGRELQGEIEKELNFIV